MASSSIPDYIMALDDPGDIDAPHGSVPWARAMRVKLTQMAHRSETTLHYFQTYLQLMDKEKGYKQLDNAFGHPFVSLKEFSITDPPYGLGYKPEILSAIQHETRAMLLEQKVAEIEALREKPGAPEGNQNAVKNNCVINTIEPRRDHGSTNRAYLLARIKRDAPDIFAAVERGEYRSARAAAKAAGIVRELTPLEDLHRIWRKVSPEDRARFLIEILTPSQRHLIAEGLYPEET